MHLFGSYSHNTDAKQRLTLPASFRKEFDQQVVLIRLPFQDCVYGFSPECFLAWTETLFPEGFDPRNKEHAFLKRKVWSSATRVDLDSAGRIALSKMGEKALEVLSGREVVVVGNDDHFEVWDAATWDAAQEEISDEDFEALFFNRD